MWCNRYVLFTIFFLFIGCNTRPSRSDGEIVYVNTILEPRNQEIRSHGEDYYAKQRDYEFRKIFDTYQQLYRARYKKDIFDADVPKTTSMEFLEELFDSVRIGPFGDGYRLNYFKKINGQSFKGEGGVDMYVLEYEVKEEALSDIEYRGWGIDNVTGRFIPRNRYIVMSKGGTTEAKAGKFVFEKTDKGWRSLDDGNLY